MRKETSNFLTTSYIFHESKYQIFPKIIH